MGLELFTNTTIQSLFVLGSGILGFIIGALVYSRDVRKVDGISFFILAWAFSMWAILLGLFESVGAGNLEYFFLNTMYIFASIIPPAVLFFATALSSGKKVPFSWQKILIAVASFVLMSFVVLSPGFLFKIIESSNTAAKEIIFGQGIFIFIFYISWYVVMSLIVLFEKYKKSAGIFKKEIQYIFLSILACAVFILFANLVLPYFGFYDFFWIGPAIGLLTAGVIGYLIIKYNFWSLKLAATDLFTSLISLTLLFELTLYSSKTDLAIKILILALVLLAGFFLVRSVRNEIENKEEVEKLAKELADVNTNLHRLDEQKSKFVAVSAHHLRDPLTAIRGYSSLILEGSFGELSVATKEAMNRISESSKRLVVIINDFMDIAKIESGKMDYVFSKVDLKKIVTDMMNEMTLAAKESGLELGFEFDETQNYRVNIDEGKIRQVVSNLVDNSIKYTPNGSVKICLRKKSDGNILLSVVDTGIGMNPETVKKIFHKFSRADEASKFHTGGSGLGLYVAKEILKKHDGRIWAESSGLGKGSIFNLELKEA